MTYLLDTHALLWFASSSPMLPDSMRSLIADANNDVAVSIASYWEIAIKAKLGKLTVESDIIALRNLALNQNIQIEPITIEAVHHTTMLPLHHKDPFDRIIAATALVTGATLVSADAAFDAYSVTRVWG
ncbi:MAG TPA: type II toxin-antitoxin system VapC family toxin [Capsulimonadaceae bacterium]|jgi:PIN domain nuclease of toxin-antitoxin system